MYAKACIIKQKRAYFPVNSRSSSGNAGIDPISLIHFRIIKKLAEASFWLFHQRPVDHQLVLAFKSLIKAGTPPLATTFLNCPR